MYKRQVVDRTVDRNGAERHRRIVDALGERDDIGHYAEVFGGRGGAETAKGRDDFIEYEQQTMPRADGAQAFQVACLLYTSRCV